jgi:hypothetical protein
MSTLRRAAQQALEALEQDNPAGRSATIIALRDALSQKEQPEPPPEAKTQAEKIAYCAGWWAAMAAKSDDAIKNYQKMK